MKGGHTRDTTAVVLFLMKLAVLAGRQSNKHAFAIQCAMCHDKKGLVAMGTCRWAFGMFQKDREGLQDKPAGLNESYTIQKLRTYTIGAKENGHNSDMSEGKYETIREQK